MVNKSPWTSQIVRNRNLNKIYSDFKTDVVIIGGGIAGITTAFFILENTNLKVAVLEAGQVAHGATGHNAGQVVMYFERPFNSIVKEFGLNMAAEGQKDLIGSWKLLKKIHKKVRMHTHLAEFIGYAGFSNKQQIEERLENKLERKKAGIVMEKAMISKEFLKNVEINKKYDKLYQIVSHEKIMSLLETNNPEYVAAFGSKKGLINSAIFTEETAEYLTKKYPKRFLIYEKNPVKSVELFEDSAVVKSKRKINCSKVILCTNGFHNIEILNKSGKEINKKFHKSVRGEIGYMAGYLEEFTKNPTAISYFRKEDEKTDTGEVYFYLTRRTYHKDKKQFNLICTGGPQIALEKGQLYHSKKHPYPTNAKLKINKFLRENYKHNSSDRVEFHYLWHGLMGYTHNLIRMIGPDPINNNIMYNLGCNGAGILSSIHGASKVALILKGKKFKPSIFDVK